MLAISLTTASKTTASSLSDRVEILAAIIAFFRGIPALAGLADKLAEWFAQYDKARRMAEAEARRATKDAAVDAGIDAVLGVPDSNGEVGQRATADEAPGLPSGSEGRARVVPRRAQNDQRAGATTRGEVR